MDEKKKSMRAVNEENPITESVENKVVPKARSRVRAVKATTFVTKDSNNMAELPLDQSIQLQAEFVEDAVVTEFSEDDFQTMQVEPKRSRTIDSTMLSKNRMRGKKEKSRKGVTADITAAQRYNPSHEMGLSLNEVFERQENGYVNFTVKKGGKSYKSIIFSNVFTIINIVAILVATALLLVEASLSQLFFMIIILTNTFIGIFQEIRSKITVEKLNLLTAPTAIVVRNGEQTVIPVGEVVLDDVILLEVGKQICADAIVIKGEVEVNESMLTGESDAVKKTIDSELFSGSYITSGTCYARVDKVGSANYVETLTSHARRYKKPKSELFKSVNLVIKVIIPIAIVVAALTMLSYYMSRPVGDKDWANNIQYAAGVTIGMLPTGMFLLTSTALVVSVIRLSKRKTLVQDLYCIEMLARVNVLCLDKTGTITDGTMQVNKVVMASSAAKKDHVLPDIIGSILTATEDNNQTARALADYFGYSKKLSGTIVMPFSSQRKFAAVTFENEGTYAYGAPEFILRDISPRLEKQINEFASNGFRVLVLAHSPSSIIKERLPSTMRAISLLVIEDHIRDDAVETIKWFRENDVEVKVISGDNPITVAEVAKRVGVKNAEHYISLDGLSNQEVIEAAAKYTVFGRVTPEQKMILVQTLKQKGKTVAMTGDGVNDILAMREADCAVSIASGAEATRNVAHLVLLDSNFTSMPEVVMEGRRVVNNIQQSSALFLMKTLMTIFLSLMALALNIDYPFKTNSLLLLEICIVGVSSFALALQSNHNLIKGKFLSNVIGRSLPGGITLTMSTLAIYFYCEIMLQEIVDVSLIYNTMLVINVTFTGFMVLVRICEPLNAYRIVLLMAVLCASTILIFVIPTVFGISEILTAQDSYFLLCTILISYFVTGILMRIMRSAKLIT